MKKLLALSALSMILVGCDSTSTTSASTGTSYTQIERLARPAINEGLLVTHALNAAYNSIPPTSDLTAAAPGQPVYNEVAGILTALAALGTAAGQTPPTATNVLLGFVPDVMRIDTSIVIPNTGALTATKAYSGNFDLVNGTAGAVILTGGRKITDDVGDVTISYLLGGAADVVPNNTLGDGVTYAGSGTNNCAIGTNPAQPGHFCMPGQVTRDHEEVSHFPFMPIPWSVQ